MPGCADCVEEPTGGGIDRTGKGDCCEHRRSAQHKGCHRAKPGCCVGCSDSRCEGEDRLDQWQIAATVRHEPRHDRIGDIGVDLNRWLERHGGGGPKAAKARHAAADQDEPSRQTAFLQSTGEDVGGRDRAGGDRLSGTCRETQVAALVERDDRVIEP